MPTPSAASAVGTLKIAPITLEKDVWENVAPIIQKTFLGVIANVNNVKRWADRQEERVKRQEDATVALEQRVEDLEVASQASQEQLQHLSEEIKKVADDSKQQIELLMNCLGSAIANVRSIFSNMGKAFGAEITDGPEIEEALDRVRAGEQTGEALQVLTNGLEHLIGGLERGFRSSTDWRQAQEERYSQVEVQLQELFAAAKATRERLLTWRERIKENAEIMTSLGASLGDTQADVRELQAAQVRRHDVEEAVARTAEELVQQIGAAEAHSEEISARMEELVAEVEEHVQEARRHADDEMEAHGNHVAQLLQQSLNPINAYLNTMHVKADATRAELDSVSEKVPKLASSIEDLASELRRRDEASCGRSEELGRRQDKLVLSLAQWGEQTQMAQADLSHEIRQRSEDLADRITEVRSSLDGTAEALEAAKKGDLVKLAKDLTSLEQKVAKWVHAHPLPAKVSEARLFSLEAKLSEEIDARLHLEQHMKAPRGSLSAREVTALPMLPRGAPKKWGA